MNKPCRCLLDGSQPDLAATVRDYVESLPPEERCGEETYRARLRLCVACEALRNGTCALCGCYVEARAAKRNQRCPKTPPLWGRYKAEEQDTGEETEP